MDALKASPEECSSEDDECYFEPNLFVNEEYTEKEFHIGNYTQPILCLESASTDFDLTGQIVWPVSVFLSWYIAQNCNLFECKKVVELGAGCGLSGLVASQFSAQTALTDGNEIVVKLLEKNAEKQKIEGRCRGQIHVSQLVWGIKDVAEKFIEQFGAPDVIIGADVVCWPAFILPFLKTVKLLLLRSSDPSNAALHLGFVNRANNVQESFFSEAIKMGFQIQAISSESFIPEETPPDVQSQRLLQLFVLRLDQNLESSREMPVFDSDDPLYESQAAPC
mmetsp:Transcript_38300/g.50476  ORF Transcript_38300/g.50476 Transcript_38300/m.50476 type:complete len:279 (+) Transcript_38300:260-1096(+)